MASTNKGDATTDVKKAGKTKTSKGKMTALARLKRAGKAVVYTNDNWKFRVTVVMCGPDEMKSVIADNVDGGPEDFNVDSMSGLTLESTCGQSSMRLRHYLLWVNTQAGIDCIGTIAHEAVHVAGLALSSAEAPCNIDDTRSSECVAYVVESLVKFSVGILVNLGIVSGKAVQNGIA